MIASREDSRALPPRRIGGSDIAKLLGVSSYGNEANVYERIVLGLEDESGSLADRGTQFEPVIRGYGVEHFGFEVEPRAGVGPKGDYYEHPTLEFAHAQVDDLALWKGLPVVVDYKTTNRWAKGWGKDGTDVVPERVRAQIAWEMLCTDRDLGILLVGFGDDVPAPEVFRITHVVTYFVERDADFEEFCLATARVFWNAHVLPRVPPSVKPIGRKRKKAS